ncbi:MAG: hypothetical protein JO011_04435, partial [Ktedonobacteraceae bacterium]|nr:hypothetical protein [Ktedonobacteraceae bacterium]
CERAAALVDKLASLSRARCRAHAEQHFSFEHMLDRHEHLYASMVG